ncbi:hypothetical protein J3Q64DRAFT_1775889 [Phycomyces blakesleeanus]|uniref:Uncharacterized protein n=1 Tax=Phycomyces blakesleeanus TaxID=4837 RepID=A0ABR3AM34_PHYBL
MCLRRLQFIFCLLLLAIIPNCYAPPIQQDTKATSNLPVVSIFRTILLGYMTHVITIRPKKGVGKFGTLHRRAIAFAYPSSGIGLAIGPIYKSLYGDRILGIFQYQSLLRSYEKETKSKDTERKDDKSQDPTDTALKDSLLLTIKSTIQYDKISADDNKKLSSEKLHSKSVHIRDRLVSDLKARNIYIGEDDNSPYLAAFLYLLGPEKAKKTKHCILNTSLIIGSNNIDQTESSDSYCATEGMIVTGPGAASKYQKKVLASQVRYMTVDMIDQLETAHNMDDTSYVESFVTIGQLFFTTIECMDLDGDRWAKVIIIIYTTMSVLQTVSLVMLHKQTMAFSIKDDKDEEASLKSDSFILTKEDRKLLGEFSDTLMFEEEDIAIISMLVGMIVFLIFGVWANYGSHGTTEWLVISWILSPISLCLVTGYLVGFDKDKVWIILWVSLLSFGAVGCLIAATVIGYLPK